MDVTLIPIGRFAKASRLTVKSLRNYDLSGLLPAAVVDPQSGYRYYRVEQLARAEVIRSLRSVDVPLPQIAEILEHGDADGRLASHVEMLVQQRDAFNHKVQRVLRMIARKEHTMSNTVTVKAVDTQMVLAYRISTTHRRVFADIPAGFGHVLGFLAGVGAEPSGPPFTVFHEFPDGDTPGDIALCVPVTSSFELPEGIESVEIAGGPVASVVHRGPYDDMGDAYAAVATWIHERGHRVAGPSREIYLNNPADAKEADLLTEIQWPIDPDQHSQ